MLVVFCGDIAPYSKLPSTRSTNPLHLSIHPHIYVDYPRHSPFVGEDGEEGLVPVCPLGTSPYMGETGIHVCHGALAVPYSSSPLPTWLPSTPHTTTTTTTTTAAMLLSTLPQFRHTIKHT